MRTRIARRRAVFPNQTEGSNNFLFELMHAVLIMYPAFDHAKFFFGREGRLFKDTPM